MNSALYTSIYNLIAQGEHVQLDFKFEINNARKIAKTLVAFANTTGGNLLIGVKDNGRVVGIKTDEEFYMIDSAANLYCKPAINIVPTKHIIDGKTILKVWVEKHSQPCYANDENDKWIAYIRIHDQNIRANKILIEVWKRKAKPVGTFIEYSKIEKELINFLSDNDTSPISKIIKALHVTHKIAEKVLINLICLNIIDININEKGALYSLKANN